MCEAALCIVLYVFIKIIYFNSKTNIYYGKLTIKKTTNKYAGTFPNIIPVYSVRPHLHQ